MSRPRKLLSASTGARSSEDIEQRKQEEELLYNYEPLDTEAVPAGITKEGYLVYKDLAPRLKQLPISVLDEGILTMYCNLFALYSEMAQEVSEYGAIDPSGKMSTAYKIMMEASKQLKSLASSLGLTLDSRMKLVIPEAQRPEPKDMFGDML